LSLTDITAKDCEIIKKIRFPLDREYLDKFPFIPPSEEEELLFRQNIIDQLKTIKDKNKRKDNYEAYNIIDRVLMELKREYPHYIRFFNIMRIYYSTVVDHISVDQVINEFYETHKLENKGNYEFRTTK
jgi:hypothetical protein